MSQEHIDLEGQHIGLSICTDYGNGTALTFYQVAEGHMARIWDPYNHAIVDTVDSRLDEKALKFLKKRGVERVYTPGDGSFWTTNRNIAEFLGTKLSWDDQDEDHHDWGHYRALDEQVYGPLFRHFKIELKFLGGLYLPSYC